MHFLNWFKVGADVWVGRWVQFVFACSILSNVLPPIEDFKDFPRFQKFYALLVNVVYHYGAMNFRGKMVQKALEAPASQVFEEQNEKHG